MASAFAHVSVNNGVPVINPHPFRVAYKNGYWNIVNLDGAAIPTNATFNILIDEHATEVCVSDRIFADGFER